MAPESSRSRGLVSGHLNPGVVSESFGAHRLVAKQDELGWAFAVSGVAGAAGTGDCCDACDPGPVDSVSLLLFRQQLNAARVALENISASNCAVCDHGFAHSAARLTLARILSESGPRTRPPSTDHPIVWVPSDLMGPH